MPEPRKSPFHKLTMDEMALAEKRARELEKVRNEAEEAANKCLNNKDFVKYRDKYERHKVSIIEHLIDYEEPDPMKYAIAVRVALAKLHQLRLLLHDVTVDNRPKGKKV